eukprot:TRINITY_DN44891_c0_g1_i1.p1 TRINITY_DN44891_c0_g1~~TRINITY_DN44891_c0_g1_i1.p1  ORF type:complete len:179 (+),score=8.59 TRINITY_DN44891_c0_g1_i1:179-715(+)
MSSSCSVKAADHVEVRGFEKNQNNIGKEDSSDLKMGFKSMEWDNNGIVDGRTEAKDSDGVDIDMRNKIMNIVNMAPIDYDHSLPQFNDVPNGISSLNHVNVPMPYYLETTWIDGPEHEYVTSIGLPLDVYCSSGIEKYVRYCLQENDTKRICAIDEKIFSQNMRLISQWILHNMITDC